MELLESWQEGLELTAVKCLDLNTIQGITGVEKLLRSSRDAIQHSLSASFFVKCE